MGRTLKVDVGLGHCILDEHGVSRRHDLVMAGHGHEPVAAEGRVPMDTPGINHNHPAIWNAQSNNLQSPWILLINLASVFTRMAIQRQVRNTICIQPARHSDKPTRVWIHRAHKLRKLVKLQEIACTLAHTAISVVGAVAVGHRPWCVLGVQFG